MHTVCVQVGKLLLRLGKYCRALAQHQRFIGFILEAQDLLSLVVIADPALEAAIRARRRVKKRLLQCGGIDGLVGQGDHVNRRQREETTALYRHH